MALKNAVLVGTDGEFRRVQVDSKLGLQPYYDLIHTDIVQFVDLTLQSSQAVFAPVKCKRFRVWCDEEGWLKADPEPNVLASVLFRYSLVGNVVIEGRSLDKFVAACLKSGIEFTDPEDNETSEVNMV